MPTFAAYLPDRARLPSVNLLRVELLAGLVVALALIPEAISFSIIAGVDPRVGLFASFTMAVAIAFTGGRPAMISAATGAMALVVVSLVSEHGVEYLLAATILAGTIQVALGLLGVAKLMRFVPRSVMTGFVNALAILIFLAQIPAPDRRRRRGLRAGRGGPGGDVSAARVTKAVPAPLVAIVLLTVVCVVGGVGVPTVGDEGTAARRPAGPRHPGGPVLVADPDRSSRPTRSRSRSSGCWSR